MAESPVEEPVEYPALDEVEGLFAIARRFPHAVVGTPSYNLLERFLELTIEECLLYRAHRHTFHELPEKIQDAVALAFVWVLQPGTGYFYSIESLCDALDLSVDQLRRQVLRRVGVSVDECLSVIRRRGIDTGPCDGAPALVGHRACGAPLHPRPPRQKRGRKPRRD